MLRIINHSENYNGIIESSEGEQLANVDGYVSESGVYLNLNAS